MPIRLNLLSEAQSKEELRRRDPVKRGIWIGVALVGLMLLWAAALQVKIMGAKSNLNAIEDQLEVQSKQYDQIIKKEKLRAEITKKLNSLQHLYTNRFLWGSTMNALQQSVLNDVQLVSFRGEQNYSLVEGIKPKTNDVGKISMGKPGSVTQRIRLQFDAKDSSPTPGDAVGKYKEALANCEFFKKQLGKTNEITLRGLSPPSVDGESGKTIVSFTLECKFPDKVMK